MNDDDVITAVQEQRDKVHSHTPVDQIISRGRTVRTRRRIPGAVSGLAVVAAGTVVLGLGLSGAFGSAPARGTGTIRTAAFTLVEHANGTATLTINNPRVLLEPRVLQRDLRQHGIPALVTAGSFCSSEPIPAGLAQVLPATTPPSFTINPAAVPAGTELSFGTFFYHPVGVAHIEIIIELIDTNSYTCTSTAPPAPSYGEEVVAMFQGGPGAPAVNTVVPAGS
jgi:hypothetical protein